jgi:hypothetical protein
VVAVQCFESEADAHRWTPEDRAWATRAAKASKPASAAAFIAERARLVLQRVAAREPATAAAAQRRWWRGLWWGGALLLGLVSGLLAQSIGPAQRLDLLAPAVAVVVLWNAVVLLALLVQATRRPPGAGAVRRLVQRAWAVGGGSRGFTAAWAQASAPLNTARAAGLLHAAAAALGLGLVAGLYARGLVLDYRAAWQSTFLDAPTVQAWLSAWLAPAVAVTGITLPDVAPLRVAADGVGGGPAAPWIHLHSTMLALFVVLPRGVLAALAAWRSQRLARALPLSLEAPYFQRLVHEQAGGSALIQVLPHGAAPEPAAVQGLLPLLASVWGDDVQLQWAAACGYGDDASASAIASPPGLSLRVLWVDLAATPEDEVHGPWARALQGPPRLLLADESAYQRRFTAWPQRTAERRALWAQWAQAQGLPFWSADLSQPGAAQGGAALARVMAA